MEVFAHGRGEGSIIQVQDVLHDVVAKGILHKVVAVRRDFADEVDLLETRRMINAALKNAAAMAVRTYGDAMLAYSVEDELGLRRLEVVQALLDDVVAVQVLNEVDDLTGQGLNDHLGLEAS
jgi:ribosomal protein S20